MAVTATLGSLDISGYLRDEVRITGPVHQWDEVSGTHADIARQANVRSSSLIEIVLPMKVTGATADALIAAVATIRAEAAKETNTLTVKPTGATNSVTYNILRSPHVVPAWNNVYDVGKVALFDLVLVAEPWAYGAAVTALNASAQTFPDGLSFKASGGDATSIAGDDDTPLTITLVPTGGEGNIHAVYMGWYPVADWTGYMVETDTAGSFVGGTAAAGPSTNASGGASVKNTGTTYSYLPVDTAAYAAGSYLVLGRVTLENAGDTGTFKLSTAAGDLTDEVTTTGLTTWHLIELGHVHLPAQTTVTGTAANLRVSMKCSAARYVAMDYLAFIPLDRGLVCYHPAVAATASASIKSELGRLYDASIVTYANASGHGIKARGAGTLVVVVDEVAANAATYSGTITVAYTPRYALWR
jgi:hypothetical protein